SRMFVLNQETEEADVLRYRPEEAIMSRVFRMLRKDYFQRLRTSREDAGLNGRAAFSDDRSPYGSDLADQLPTRNVVHLHSVSGFLDFRKIFPLLADRPLVWTLHDM